MHPPSPTRPVSEGPRWLSRIVPLHLVAPPSSAAGAGGVPPLEHTPGETPGPPAGVTPALPCSPVGIAGEVSNPSPQPSTLNAQPASPAPFSPAPNESPQAFAAFLVYFQLPAKRRLTAVARKTGDGLRSVYRWAHDFDWAGRVNRHQAGLVPARAQLEAAPAREEAIAWAERAVVVREREWEFTDDLFEALQQRLRAGEHDSLSLAALTRAFALASRIARQTTGLAAQSPDATESPDPREKEFDAALEAVCGPQTAGKTAEPTPAPLP